MNSRERILAALRSEDVDYIPFAIEWNQNQKLHERLSWKNERERLAFHHEKGWDTYLNIGASVTPTADVIIEKRIETNGESKLICQSWKTPAGELTEKIKLTGDWDKSELNGPYLMLNSDFRTPRYVEFPFKDLKDLDALEYIFPVENPADTEKLTKHYYDKRKLADEFNYPLFVYFDAGMDWLMWLYPAEESVVRIVEEPEYVERLLDHINKAKHRRLELLLELGVDGVTRRGWYESTDFWSPEIFRKFAKPALEKEIEMTHAAGKTYTYLMVTGINPLLPELASLKFDCLLGPEPVLGGQDLKQIHDALPGKAIWGGLSGPGHFGADTPDKVERAVDDIISICGKTGLVLGMGASYRYYWSFENFEAAVKTWKRLR